MRPYHTTTTTATARSDPTTPATPGPAAASWELIRVSVAASAVILIGGAGLLGAIAGDWPDPRGLRYVAILAASPWALAGVLLLAAAGRLAWNLLELTTGRDLDHSGAVGPERIRIIPYRGSAELIDGTDPADLRAFVTVICDTGDWTQATWRGRALPSGRKCTDDYHAALCAILKKTGVIVGAGPRRSGELTTRDAGEVCRLLGLPDAA